VHLYRATRNNPPTEEDMKSHWDLGKRPLHPRDEASYREVSVFDTLEAAARKARAFRLGAYIARLEVPDGVAMTRSPSSGHVGLAGTNPAQLLGYVQHVQGVDEVLD